MPMWRTAVHAKKPVILMKAMKYAGDWDMFLSEWWKRVPNLKRLTDRLGLVLL